MKTDTPRTDSKIYGGAWEVVVPADFCRTLERELAAKEMEIARLQTTVEEMSDCIRSHGELLEQARACNSHAQLVEAVKALLDAADEVKLAASPYESDRRAIDKARAALTAAQS